MIKRYLLSYRMFPFQGFDETGFGLNVKSIYFWGMFTRTEEVDYFVPNHHNLTKYIDHWKKMIIEGTPFKT